MDSVLEDARLALLALLCCRFKEPVLPIEVPDAFLFVFVVGAGMLVCGSGCAVSVESVRGLIPCPGSGKALKCGDADVMLS